MSVSGKCIDTLPIGRTFPEHPGFLSEGCNGYSQVGSRRREAVKPGRNPAVRDNVLEACGNDKMDKNSYEFMPNGIEDNCCKWS
jgi:hypothetical protein